MMIRTTRQAMAMALLGGTALIGAAAALMPGAADLAAATHRAALAFAGPASHAPAVQPVPGRTPAMLATMFAQGAQLTTPELKWLLASSTAHADAVTLAKIAGKVEEHEPVSTAQVVWDILASDRPQVALAFLEQRADRTLAANWQLRFDLHRRVGDVAFARSMVHAAATTGTSPEAGQLVAAAYAVDAPEDILLAAERRVIPALDRPTSLDLARRAASTRRLDLIPRIDRAGTPAWRQDDPWLAMDLARKSGDTAGALRYAALLPSGRDEARRTIVMTSGDRQAIRSLLLEQAANGPGRPAAAQQLLQAGFRSDAIALLQADAASRAPDDPVASRLLYLMGPRPDATGLQWLRGRAAQSPAWMQAYLVREKPAAALAFLTAQPGEPTTDGLIQRLKLASAARDRQAAGTLVGQLLDGQRLSSEQTNAIAASAPPHLGAKWTLALARARLANGSASPQDRLDLAWDSWNRGRAQEARGYLAPYLAATPQDGSALKLMAEVDGKLQGKAAARPWLERALAGTPERSLERVQLLERLGRAREALPIAAGLHEAAPADARITATYGRLLIAAGDPGRARKVLAR